MALPHEGSPPAAPPGPAGICWNASPDTQAVPQRSVSLPFTAPALTVMRVRVAQKGGLEMLLSNPAGGRGVYVARWATLRAYASPSLHDILLAERIADPASMPGPLSPASVRAVALAVAAEGHAGRRLAQAAETARQAELLGLRRLRAHLLLELARTLALPGADSPLNDPWSTRPQEHAGWLAQAPRLLAARLEWMLPWQSSELADAIARIAALAWPLGIGPRAAQARLPRVLRLLSNPARPGRGLATPGSAMALHVAQAEAALVQARTLLDHPLELLSAWHTDQAGMIRVLEQPDWLLDGCDRLCLLPDDAPEAGLLVQMLLYKGETRIALNRAELEGAGPSGLTGAAAAFDRQTRNETLRLRELQLQDPDGADIDA